MLNTTKELENGELFIALEGRLDTVTALPFESELEKLLPEVRQITMDFEELDYVSSAGLRSLLTAQQYMEDNGYPDVKILHVNNTIMNIFQLTGFDKVLDVVE